MQEQIIIPKKTLEESIENRIRGINVDTGFRIEKMYSEEDMREVFNAGSAFAVASHINFKQTHPNFEEWLKKLKKN